MPSGNAFSVLSPRHQSNKPVRRRLRRRIHISVHLDRSINAPSRNYESPLVGLAITPLEASSAAAAAAALAPSRRARLPPAAAAPVLVGAGSHPSTPSLPAYPWPGGSIVLACSRSSSAFLLCLSVRCVPQCRRMASRCPARVPSPRCPPRHGWAGSWVSLSKCGASGM